MTCSDTHVNDSHEGENGLALTQRCPVTHKIRRNVCTVHKVASKGDIDIKRMRATACARREDGCSLC